MNIAFVFPGQGSQIVGMGRDVYEAAAAARAIFEQADATLGIPLTQLCFEGPQQTLTATENAQPALLTTSIALLALLAGNEHEIPAFVSQHAGFVAGHSLGEFTALVAAGALDLPTALRLVRRRGELMAAANQGRMSVIIGMATEDVVAICDELSTDDNPVVIANYNAPGQMVISGANDAVQRAMDLALECGALYARPLNVSAAFHSPLMREIAPSFAAVLRDAEIRHAKVPIISNVTAQPLLAAESIYQELTTQISASVRWIASTEYMASHGIDTFVSIGPGTVLTNLIKRIVPGARLMNVSDTVEAQTFLEANVKN